MAILARTNRDRRRRDLTTYRTIRGGCLNGFKTTAIDAKAIHCIAQDLLSNRHIGSHGQELYGYANTSCHRPGDEMRREDMDRLAQMRVQCALWEARLPKAKDYDSNFLFRYIDELQDKIHDLNGELHDMKLKEIQRSA